VFEFQLEREGFQTSGRFAWVGQVAWVGARRLQPGGGVPWTNGARRL